MLEKPPLSEVFNDLLTIFLRLTTFGAGTIIFTVKGGNDMRMIKANRQEEI